MITIIFGKPGHGKTSLMSYFANEMGFDRLRLKRMQEEVKLLNANGYNLVIPQTVVATNYNLVCRKYKYSPRLTRNINPYRIGFYNEDVMTEFIYPYQGIFITEAQRYLNSRKSKDYPDWQSRMYEFHRHDDLDIYLDVQRPDLIDLNVRALATFIECESCTVTYDCYGRIKIVWHIKRFEDNTCVETYLKNPNEKGLYVSDVITCDYNIFECYDSKTAKPLFLDLRNKDLAIRYNRQVNYTLKDVRQYLEDYEGQIPKGFYGKGK